MSQFPGTAFEDGQDSFDHDQEFGVKTENPYPKFTQQHKDWQAGYESQREVEDESSEGGQGGCDA